MKRIIILVFTAIIAFSACKKDDDKTDPALQKSVLDYFPLSVGNYWVYERSYCDTTWTDCEMKSIDTTFVTKDTVINGFKYFKIEGVHAAGQYAVAFLRDSLDYIVSSTGGIVFSDTDFDNKLSEEFIVNGLGDTLFYWYRQMQEDLYTVDIPAGTFNCLDNKLFFYRKSDNFEKASNTHYLFTKNIGPVFNQAMFAHSGTGFKQELVDYKIVTGNSK